MIKKVLAGVLAFAVVFSIPGVSVAAQDTETFKQIVTKEVSDEAGGIISGDYEYILLDDGTIEITHYRGKESNLVIPSQIDGYKVTSLRFCILSYPQAVTSVTIPATVTNIDEVALSGARLTDIILEPGCTAGKVVGGVLFSADGTKLLQYPARKTANVYNIPYGVTYISASAFAGAENLEMITIPEGISVIDYGVFAYCSNLKKVTIPAGITMIMWGAFDDCDSLKDVYYGGSEADWANITIDDSNVSLLTATIYYDWSVDSFVNRMYKIALDRNIDPTGYANWVAGLKSGTYDGAGIARGIFLSPEFEGFGLSNEEFLNRLYRTFFNREADVSGYNNWMHHLNCGYSREFVLSNFVNSEEFDNLCRSFNIERGVMMTDGNVINMGISKFVQRLYSVVLGRTADWQGYTNWALAFAVGTQTPGQIVASFFNSDEYLSKQTTDETFVADLYSTFFNRVGDGDGYATWVVALYNGMSRDSVIAGFAASQEFVNLLAVFGL